LTLSVPDGVYFLSRLAIVLSVLQFIDFDYPFGIFNLFLQHWVHKTQDTCLDLLTLAILFRPFDFDYPV
jgi:hypothetical protein